MNPGVPILEFDPDRAAVIEPHMIRERLEVPTHAVPCFFSDVIEKVCVNGGAKVLTELQAAHGVHPSTRSRLTATSWPSSIQA